jgi:hypothetical protein
VITDVLAIELEERAAGAELSAIGVTAAAFPAHDHGSLLARLTLTERHDAV